MTLQKFAPCRDRSDISQRSIRLLSHCAKCVNSIIPIKYILPSFLNSRCSVSFVLYIFLLIFIKNDEKLPTFVFDKTKYLFYKLPTEIQGKLSPKPNQCFGKINGSDAEVEQAVIIKQKFGSVAITRTKSVEHNMPHTFIIQNTQVNTSIKRIIVQKI